MNVKKIQYQISNLNLLKKQVSVSVLAIIIYGYGLFPGRVYIDSAQLFSMMRNNESSDQWTALFYRYLQITSVNGRYLFSSALFSATLLYASLIWFVNSFKVSESNRLWTFTVVAMSPFMGIFGFTVGHDVTASVGILILIGYSLREKANHRFTLKFLAFFITFLLCATSLIGLLAIFGFSLKIFLQNEKILALLLICVALLSIFSSSAILRVNHHDKNLILMSILGDLKCVAQQPMAKITPTQWVRLQNYGNMQEWKAPKSCALADYSFFALKNASDSPMEIFILWKDIAQENYQIVLMARIQRSSVSLPPLFFRSPPNMFSVSYDEPVGVGSASDLQIAPDLFKTSIDSSLFIGQSLPMQLPLQSLLLLLAFIFNQRSDIWGWGGLWLSLTLIFGRKVTSKSRGLFLLDLLPLVILHVGLVFFTPSPSPRYVMPSILIGLSVVVSRVFLKMRS